MRTENYIDIGKFRLTPLSDKSIWISLIDDGEGGEFSIGEIERRIEALYEEQF